RTPVTRDRCTRRSLPTDSPLAPSSGADDSRRAPNPRADACYGRFVVHKSSGLGVSQAALDGLPNVHLIGEVVPARGIRQAFHEAARVRFNARLVFHCLEIALKWDPQASTPGLGLYFGFDPAGVTLSRIPRARVCATVVGSPPRSMSTRTLRWKSVRS